MSKKVLVFPVCLITAFLVPGCGQKESKELTELKHFPVDNTQGIITQSGVQLDKQTSADGNGSLRIDAADSTAVRLFEVGDMDVENARLI
jgi:hypothetical protein